MEGVCSHQGIKPPPPHTQDKPAVARMTCPAWWRRQLRKHQGRTVEAAAIGLGYVNKNRDLYVSEERFKARMQQNRRNAATLAATTARNEWGQVFTLAELVEKSPANKRIRRGELMTRIAGCEVYADIEALITKLITQSAGNIELDTPITLAMSPKSSMALTITNSFGLTPKDMLSKSFPNVKIETAIQYGVQSTQNPQGNAACELVQAIATTVEGQATGFCSFNEKLRTFQPVRGLSSWQQKFAQGTWGAIIKQPFAIAQMLGI